MLSFTRRLLAPTLFAFCGLTLLSGCAPLIVGGTAVTSAVVATDRRTAGEQLEDQVIELKIVSVVRDLALSDARVNAMSYAGVVLLTGDVANATDSLRVERGVRQVEKVQRVINRLRVGAVTPLSVRNNDVWLTSKVRTALLQTKEVPSRTIIVTTERGTVYLMGRVTRPEAERAARAAAQINGVNQVATLFEHVSPTQQGGSAAAAPQADAPPITPPAPPKAEPAESTNVEIMPVQ